MSTKPRRKSSRSKSFKRPENLTFKKDAVQIFANAVIQPKIIKKDLNRFHTHIHLNFTNQRCESNLVDYRVIEPKDNNKKYPIVCRMNSLRMRSWRRSPEEGSSMDDSAC